MQTNATKIIRGLIISSLLAVPALTLGDAPAFASGSNSADLAVSASVSDNCTITTAPVSFGAYDPVSANLSSPLLASGSVTVQCTSGATAAIGLAEGLNKDAASTPAVPLRQMTDGSAHMLAYRLYQDSGTTVWGDTAGTRLGHSGDGTAHSLTVFGQVLPNQQVPSGSYADTVVATVYF